MKLFIHDSQIPELKGFSKDSQSWLKRLAIQQLKNEKGGLILWVPAIAGVLGVGAGALISLAVVSMLWPSFPTMWFEHRLLRNYVASAPGAIAVGGFMGFIGKQLVIARLRPYLRKLVETKPNM